MRAAVIPSVVMLLVGGVTGASLALALQEAKPVVSKPRLLCETDASQIARAYAEAPGAEFGTYMFDCQEATGPEEHPLEGASLAPEYRCFLSVQLASSRHQLDCQPR